jgi:hypothetical protein
MLLIWNSIITENSCPEFQFFCLESVEESPVVMLARDKIRVYILAYSTIVFEICSNVLFPFLNNRTHFLCHVDFTPLPGKMCRQQMVLRYVTHSSNLQRINFSYRSRSHPQKTTPLQISNLRRIMCAVSCVYGSKPEDTVTRRGCAWLIDGVRIGWLDLLTPYTLNSELRAITALSLIHTLHISPLHTH